jgi:hypothetical protein
MRTKLLRLSEKDFVKHLAMPETDSAPIYFYYNAHGGHIQLWPPDVNNQYEISITIEEKQ